MHHGEASARQIGPADLFAPDARINETRARAAITARPKMTMGMDLTASLYPGPTPGLPAFSRRLRDLVFTVSFVSSVVNISPDRLSRAARRPNSPMMALPKTTSPPQGRGEAARPSIRPIAGVDVSARLGGSHPF